jgi:hypothetical protein
MAPRGTRIGSLVLMQVRQQMRSNMSLSYARFRLLKLPLTWPLKRALSLSLQLFHKPSFERIQRVETCSLAFVIKLRHSSPTVILAATVNHTPVPMLIAGCVKPRYCHCAYRRQL